MEILDLRSRNCVWGHYWGRDGHLLVNFFFPVPSVIQSQKALRKLTRLSLLLFSIKLAKSKSIMLVDTFTKQTNLSSLS